ncbi:DUF1627 domain-containing protein [Pectobacterium aroidearum]|uniref:DUF1627 domain-containing protein n=1 Tax=Pectobacterium aroidearum TaxID=1201031 RepID=UPI0032EC95E4
METLLDVLKAMEKATAREIAARMKIDVREMLDMLREHEEREQVYQVNGMWQLAGSATKPLAPPTRSEKPTLPAPVSLKATITADGLICTISDRGPLTADELARLTGTTSRKIASTLAMATNRGRIVRQAINGRFCYCMPEKKEAPVANPECKQAERDDAFVKAIPSLKAKSSVSMQIPTSRALAKEIRRTKARLAQLERCRGALRELGKFRKTLEEF